MSFYRMVRFGHKKPKTYLPQCSEGWFDILLLVRSGLNHTIL
ncbi:MAG: hypothetical protein RBS33_06450 [Lentimicrobium sp.]|nr:hypothetical protein [Lentimicrobiaceae bacterium]MDY0025606.1 hypothetical protein [Lentimicrobium sp.]